MRPAGITQASAAKAPAVDTARVSRGAASVRSTASSGSYELPRRQVLLEGAAVVAATAAAVITLADGAQAAAAVRAPGDWTTPGLAVSVQHDLYAGFG